jgi:hypothetical protein
MKKLIVAFILIICMVCLGAEKPIPDKVMVQIVFTEEVLINGTVTPFVDALYVPIASYSTLTPTALASMKKARVDNWLKVVKNPPKPKEPTKKELEAEIEELEKQKASLDLRKVELQAKIVAINEVK